MDERYGEGGYFSEFCRSGQFTKFTISTTARSTTLYHIFVSIRRGLDGDSATHIIFLYILSPPMFHFSFRQSSLPYTHFHSSKLKSILFNTIVAPFFGGSVDQSVYFRSIEEEKRTNTSTSFVVREVIFIPPATSSAKGRRGKFAR